MGFPSKSLEWMTQSELIRIINYTHVETKRFCAVIVYLLFQSKKDIGDAIARWNELTLQTFDSHFSQHHAPLFPRIYCKDGFHFSAQGGWSNYCTPRETLVNKYTSVEIGFPSKEEPLFTEQEHYEGDIIGWCPTGVVNKVITKHDGLWTGEGFYLHTST